eukprot:GSA120T00023285001.1
MHKIDTSWSLSFEVAHDKFREHQNPGCHAVSAKKTAPVMAAHRLPLNRLAIGLICLLPNTGLTCSTFYALQIFRLCRLRS